MCVLFDSIVSSADPEGIKQCPFATQKLNTEALPTFLGGGCTCTAKGGCIQGVPNGCTAPKQAAGADGMTAVYVASRDSHSVVLTAKAPGERLAWTVEVAAKGIEISAELKPADGGPAVTLVAAQKVKAEDGAVEGVATAPAAGCITVLLDNRYSMVTGKNIKYSTTILPAAEKAVEVTAATEKLDEAMAQKMKALNVGA